MSENSISIFYPELPNEEKTMFPKPSFGRVMSATNNVAFSVFSTQLKDMMTKINSIVEDVEEKHLIGRETHITFSLGVSPEGKIGVLGISGGVSGNASISVTVKIRPTNS